MPYEWHPANDPARPTLLRLWPHRSLPPEGFVWFVGTTAVLISLPLLVLLGSPVLWGLLPFFIAAIAALWWALQRSHRDREILETLTLGPERVALTREGPRARRQSWEANTHWVRLVHHAKGGPVPHYLTLQGGPREVEIGAFLSEEERVALHSDLQKRLVKLASEPGGHG